MNINNQSIQSFLGDRGIKTQSRLYVKNNELRYADIGCGYRFAARLGFGNASMANVAKFIRNNHDTCFANTNEITTYNDFITSYNGKQCVSWKKAKTVQQSILLHSQTALSSDEAPEVIKKDDVQNPLPSKPSVSLKAVPEFTPDTTGTPFGYGSKEEVHKLVKHHLANCMTLLNDPDLDEAFTQLTETCQTLNLTLQAWELDKVITKEEKKTLNDILIFKNTVRNTIFPPKEKPLKGADCVYNPLNTISQADKDSLKMELKEVRTQVLQKYFRERLEADAARLVQLRFRFNENENKGTLPEEAFLKAQLQRWETKHAHGKPIAIPKWYHCTKTPNAIDNIIATDILYKHDGMYPGVFVANLPEHGYGTHCLMLSDHIEKTGIKDSSSKDPVYPKFSNMTKPTAIKYSDTPEESQYAAFSNNQDGLGIWFGFQRGLNSNETAGIPIQKMKRIKDGALKYYKDTTLGFIYSANNYNNNGKELEKTGLKYRVPVITQSEANSLRTLINATFFCTLPASWDGKLQRC